MNRQLPLFLTALLLAAASTLSTGCTTARNAADAPMATVGFLSTYRNLEPASRTSMKYLDPNNRLARYDNFIVMPVEIREYTDSDATELEKQMICDEMRDAIINALSQRYPVVSTPTGNTAEVHVAITNIRKSAPFLNVIPRPKISDLGIGGLSIEAEVLDSVSSVQIAALIESASGQNRTLDFSTLDDSRAVMVNWANRLVAVVDEAHQRAAVATP
jgi:hypothetical protein